MRKKHAVIYEHNALCLKQYIFQVIHFHPSRFHPLTSIVHTFRIRKTHRFAIFRTFFIVERRKSFDACLYHIREVLFLFTIFLAHPLPLLFFPRKIDLTRAQETMKFDAEYVTSSLGHDSKDISNLHISASIWCEELRNFGHHLFCGCWEININVTKLWCS